MPVIADTGPPVAFFDKAERHHRWAIERIEEAEAPLLIFQTNRKHGRTPLALIQPDGLRS